MHLPVEFGRYTLVERIARGGSAEIYRATFSSPGGFSKMVAIKMLLRKFVGVKELEGMLIDEARVLTYLRHQSIVQVLDLGDCDGVPFIAMEYIEGVDCARLLRELIRNDSSLLPKHALYIIEQVLRALEFAHRCVGEDGEALNVVHRDISPSNILLSFNGEVKVTDFGIAKGGHRTSLTEVGQIKGKYSYMAPEQARGAPLDGRADIFACGVVLAELLTGRRIFDGANDLEVLERVRNVSLIDGMLDEIPSPLRAIIILAMAKDPAIRYQNAAQMLEDVKRVAAKLETQSSSLDLSVYIGENFPREFKGSSPTEIGSHPLSRVTRVCSILSGAGSGVSSRGFRMMRNVCMTIIVLLIIPISPSRGRAIDSKTINSKAIAGDAVSIESERGEIEKSGAIAIDSQPRGARGKLIIGEISREIVTPFAISDIVVGDGVFGSVELSMKGYKSHRADIELTPNSPTFTKKVHMSLVKRAKLSVHARPWGVVSVGSVLRLKESPINALRLNAGEYLVRVHHPPSGKTLARKVLLAGGSSVRCFASFGAESAMKCR